MEGLFERGERSRVIAAQEQSEAPQVFRLGSRAAVRLRTFELAEGRLVVAAQQVLNRPVTDGWPGCSERECGRQQQGRSDQAAPRTWSSI
jgi:hypothetical protein